MNNNIEYIKENVEKFEKLYEIVLEEKKFVLLTPNYFKKIKTLIYLSGFLYNLFQLEDIKIFNEEMLDYKEEIENFHNDSIDIYNTLLYDNEIEEVISSL
jgi:hypothetical protein